MKLPIMQFSRVRVPMRSNPSSCTMVLGLTQPLTETSTRNFPGGKGRWAHQADNLTAICKPTVYIMREPLCLTTLWDSMACYRDSFAFFFTFYSLSLRFKCFLITLFSNILNLTDQVLTYRKQKVQL
jgi:hypothetical protein